MLIFDWRRVPWVRRRLVLCLLAAVLLIIGWFYLFRVSLPPPGRSVPVGRSLSIVNNPAASKDLRVAVKARRNPAALRHRGGSGDSEALRAVVPAWRPSWEARPAPLRELPVSDAVIELPAIIPDSAVLLPPTEGAEPLRLLPGMVASDPEAPPLITPILTIHSGLGGRSMLAPPRWNPAGFDEAWPRNGSVDFMLAVDETGRVRHCFPLRASSGADPEKLRPEILNLRWSPAAGQPLTWGTVDLRW